MKRLLSYVAVAVLAPCLAAEAAVDAWPDYLSTSRSVTPTWAHTLRGPLSEKTVLTYLSQGDFIGTVGGPNTFDAAFGQGDVALGNYIATLEAGGLDDYKAKIYAAGLAAVDAERATGNVAYWLLGNEINSNAHSTAWQPYADGIQTGKSNDPSYIPAFAEYFLAPIVETLLRVEADTGADIHIMMGSIANGSGAAQRAWATELYNYTFVGTYAPGLAGKRVSDFMEYAAFHYSITDDNWEDTLDFYHAMKLTGAVRGIMDTEEIGNHAMDRGVGPYQALLGFSRVMHWAIKHDRSADDLRTNYWSETQDYASEAMTLLHDFLGDTVVTELTAPTVTATGATESYAFEADGKRVLFVFAGMSSSVTLTNVSLGARGATAGLAGTLHVFSPSTTSAGLISSAISSELSGDTCTLSVNVTLPKEGVAMFVLEETAQSPVPRCLKLPTKRCRNNIMTTGGANKCIKPWWTE